MSWRRHVAAGLTSNYSISDILWYFLRLKLGNKLIPFIDQHNVYHRAPLQFLYDIEYSHLKDYQHVASPITVVLNKLRGIRPVYYACARCGEVQYKSDKCNKCPIWMEKL